MARKHVRCPRVLHHIMVQRINTSSIFDDDQERRKILERLENITEISRQPELTGVYSAGLFLITSVKKMVPRVQRDPKGDSSHRLLSLNPIRYR